MGPAALSTPELVHRDEELDAGEGAYREDLGVGEVDELEDAVDHRIAQRDGGVDEAERDPVDEDLGQVDEGVGDDVDALRVEEELVRPRAPAQEGEDEHQGGEERSGADDEHRHPAQGQHYFPQGPQAQGSSHGASNQSNARPLARGRGSRKVSCGVTRRQVRAFARATAKPSLRSSLRRGDVQGLVDLVGRPLVRDRPR